MFLSRRISSFFSLLLIFLFAFFLGTIIIVKSSNLKKLEEPIRFDAATDEFSLDDDITY